MVTVTSTLTLNGVACTSQAAVQPCTLTVRPAFTAGAIATTGESVCPETTTLTEIGNFTDASGGEGIISYQWYCTHLNSTQEAEGDATSATYTPASAYTNVPGTYTFTRRAKDATCNTILTPSTGSWVLTVYPRVIAGDIGNNSESLCEGATPATISAGTLPSGGNGEGFEYQWRVSTDNGQSYTTNAILPEGASYTATYTPAVSYTQNVPANGTARYMFKRYVTICTFSINLNGDGIVRKDSSAVEMQRCRLCQFLFHGGSPLGVIDRAVSVYQSDRLVIHLPMFVVLVARICFQADNLSIAGKSQRAAMKADCHQCVAVCFLQLFNHAGCRRAIRTPLTREVLEQNDTLCRLGLLVYQALSLGDMVAGGKHQADAT